MSDMREPVTVDFHRAKRHADGLRPAEDEKPDADRLGEYRVAVRDLQVAFDIAEREARRRRAMDFPFEERRSLDRDRKSTRLNSSHVAISYAGFCLKKKNRVKRRRA